MRRRTRRHAEPWKGLAAGLAGGLVASWVMNEFQAGWSKAAAKLHPHKESESQQSQEDGEGPTEKVAGAISSTLLHRELSKEQKKKLGPVVHYATGAIMGGAYGLLAEMLPATKVGFGAAYGTAVFAGLDEAGLAALGLAKSPTEYPLSTHAYALASHVVYGTATEGVRRALRTIW